jgi:hypothetical protein
MEGAVLKTAEGMAVMHERLTRHEVPPAHAAPQLRLLELCETGELWNPNANQIGAKPQ